MQKQDTAVGVNKANEDGLFTGSSSYNVGCAAGVMLSIRAVGYV